MKLTMAAGLLLPTLIAHNAQACSIEELRKLAAEPLERLPGGFPHDIDSPRISTDGADYREFIGENKTPHSLLITVYGESGDDRLRISFLNRHDYVIVDTRMKYDEAITDPARTGKFKILPSNYYFFCGDELQIPPGLSAAEANRITSDGYENKHLIFDELTILRPEIDRVPENSSKP